MAPALFLVPAALASFILAFGTGVEFVRFTSLRPLLGGVPESGPDVRQGWLAALQDPSILAPLAWDLGLLLLFVGQHSLMATDTVKALSSRYFGVLQRSLYVTCTALALQVYYHVLGLGEPLALKSPRALRLFSHLRHPVCVELLTVLWVVPTLSTDRFLLALLLTLYLGLAHGLDQHDLRYLRAQLQRKLHLLSRPQDGDAE
ncbi:PREDICTED: nurim isoform X3 [Chrysochloris asiatica]|uniref:Nurim n=1 Tax=Chrysochloris asiatica TaxID=185453 RepID=A0A9B0U3S2_CHRAS|nr:PREDICTED: nurim isoform X3 [Chrysochloris asiatica]